MSREDLILRPGDARSEDGHLSIALRMPWYRSLPLTSVMDIRLRIDGVALDIRALDIRLDGTVWRFDDFAAAFDTVWFIQDTAIVSTGIPIEPGAVVEVVAGVALRLPYIIIEGVGPLQRYNEIHREMVVA